MLSILSGGIMNYSEIYNKIYKSLLSDGYLDDHYQFGIVQITRSAASDIAYHLWRFLLACENHSSPSANSQVINIVSDTINSINNSIQRKSL